MSIVAGGCHCGAVRFEADLVDGLDAPVRCNCSYCQMRGVVAVAARASDLHITRGADRLSTYRFNTRVAEHHFCPDCGIHTHYRRRSNPDEVGVSVACIDGASVFDLADVSVLDGVHHVRDGNPRRLAGTLHFDPAT